MTQTNHGEAKTSPLTELLTKAETGAKVRRTPSGVDKLRARDPSFPKPFKDGTDRRARVYFVAAEVDAWVRRKLDAREVA